MTICDHFSPCFTPYASRQGLNIWPCPRMYITEYTYNSRILPFYLMKYICYPNFLYYSLHLPYKLVVKLWWLIWSNQYERQVTQDRYTQNDPHNPQDFSHMFHRVCLFHLFPKKIMLSILLLSFAIVIQQVID